MIEPFFNSGAVLLARPQPFDGVETCNDLDHYIANFWRSTQYDPEGVVEWADGPVSEVDLHSMHRWLVLGENAEEFRRRMRADPDYYDPKVAGRWVRGICMWIGSGWCSVGAEWEQMPLLRGEAGASGAGVHVTQKKSKVRIAAHNPGSYGKGVHAKGDTAEGPIATVRDGGRPQLADAYDIGRGVHASPPEGLLSQQVPAIGTGGNGDGTRGVHVTSAGGTCAERRAWLLDWFGRLRDRLRNVRVCCGDWKRVCSSESVTTRLGITAVFMDPPYGTKAKRTRGLYAQDSLTVADEVRRWCLERGGDRQMRIALCGYSGEGHEELEQHGWRAEEWKAGGGYGNRTEEGKKNARRERIFFSPHCRFERGLFDEAGGM